MKSYCVQIELPDAEHLQYIEDLTSVYADFIEIKVCSGSYHTGTGISVVLTGQDLVILNQVSAMICNRVNNLNHIDRCTYFSFGFKYWISYIKRIIDRVCYQMALCIANNTYNNLKKEIDKRTFRYLK